LSDRSCAISLGIHIAVEKSPLPALPAQPLGEERMRLIDAIGLRLSGVVGYDQVIRAAAQCAVPGLAELVILGIREEGTDRLEVAHVDPDQEQPIAERLNAALPAIRRAIEQDLSQGRAFRWLPYITDSSLRFLTRLDPAFQQLFKELQVRSLMVVPLRSGSRTRGVMAFARVRAEAQFQAADLAVAQMVARRAAAQIEKAALYERSRNQETQRTHLEDALQKWVRVFDLAGWGAAIVDGADQRIETVNPAFARIHGYPDPAALTGRPFAELLDPEHRDDPERWLTDEGRSEPYESVHVRSDGTRFPVLVDVTILTTGADTTSYVVTVQETSELKRAQDRLRGAQRMEAVGRLAGGVAHEVNNMMTIILGFSDLLGRTADLPEERQRELEEIRKAATRAGKITQQLLAFSRQQILQPSDLQLNEVVAEFAALLRLLMPANIRIETSLSPVSSTLHVDRAQLDQVLINLAFNARDAMAAGGTLKLVTGSRWLNEADGRHHIGIPIPPGQYALVSVVDSGHGMDPTTIDHVFEPFFTTKPLGTGTGLGLATVYGIVKQSGGFVWIESKPGIGTTVTVSVPEVYRPIPVGKERRPSDRIEGCRIGGTVLVVEDEEAVRELACRVLEEEGFQALQASSAAKVIEMLEIFGDEIDLVLSDVIVADMAPAELERRLRVGGRKVPILYMSGYSREEVVERGLIRAGSPFLQKPFTPEELTEVVCRQLETVAGAGGRPVTT
jgi:two-component system cell cycle sensor histidine kinase/response regulator CckA